MKAGHASGAITDRYIHATQVLFPGAAAKGEERMFGRKLVEKIDPPIAPPVKGPFMRAFSTGAAGLEPATPGFGDRCSAS